MIAAMLLPFQELVNVFPASPLPRKSPARVIARERNDRSNPTVLRTLKNAEIAALPLVAHNDGSTTRAWPEWWRNWPGELVRSWQGNTAHRLPGLLAIQRSRLLDDLIF
jgi:hypothetical protein